MSASPVPLADNHPAYLTCKAVSRQSGNRCKRRPVPGAAVCVIHGGGAPQVRRAAAFRLLELVDPAVATLAREMMQADNSTDRQRAANSILDRAGIVRVTRMETGDARDLLLMRLMELRDQDGDE